MGPKRRATRERIVRVAAELIYEHGAQNTNNEQIRTAAGVSGSQLTRHFPTKESLVHAVLAWQADSIVARHQRPELGELDSFAALRRWADSYIASQDMLHGGCTFGSLAAEIVKTEPSHRDAVADGFERWQELFKHGLSKMRKRGKLRPEADPAAPSPPARSSVPGRSTAGPGGRRAEEERLLRTAAPPRSAKRWGRRVESRDRLSGQPRGTTIAWTSDRSRQSLDATVACPLASLLMRAWASASEGLVSSSAGGTFCASVMISR